VIRAIPAELRALVLARAHGRCEYCGLAQAGQEATFHIDHVMPLSAGGATDEHNLASACVGCSLRKGARQRAIDPETGAEVALFNPRAETWTDHFRWVGFLVDGLSPTGRATVAAFGMNRPLMVAIREEESILGRHPPD
jgi:hypothetical protein